MEYKGFTAKIKEAADFFSSIKKDETIRVVSHLDTDGICSVSLLVKILNIENRKYSVSVIPTLTEAILEEYKQEGYNYYLFSDLGSGSIEQIGKRLNKKKILVLDHHTPESKKEFDNIVHVNPHLFGIDGGKEISGSGVVYLFAKEVDRKMEGCAHLAVIGAVGDIQDVEGLFGLNKEILGEAIRKGKIRKEKTLRVFGINTRPLYRILQYSTNPRIPGITGSESAAIQFLQQMGIDPKKGSDWRLFSDLTLDEKKKLALGIIMKRKDEERPDDVFGDAYMLLEEEEPELMDAKQFSTLLNACGRLGKASFGIGVCLNDKKAKKRAIENLNKYKREIVGAMNWYRDNQDSEQIIKREGFMIMNAEDNIRPTMIGTISSMISKSGELKDKTYLMSLARNVDRTTKVSLRITGENNENIDLREVISEIVKKVGGEAGGHMNAAGAVISTKKEEEFIKEAGQVLKRIVMEEVVV